MATDPERVKAIFLAAAEKPDDAARAAYLASACADDGALQARVEALLRAHDTADSFLGMPAAEVAHLEETHTMTLAGSSGPGSGRADHSAARSEDDEELLSFLTPSSRADSLGRIGRYEVLEILGKGAFGTVFRAFDDVLHRVVAIKVLAPRMAATSPTRKRFLREARSSAAVRHDNVVQVHEVEEKPLPYLVMEFIPGETLQQNLNRVGPLDVPAVVEIGRQLALGLAAHATGLIHRDIKPGNILLTAGPQTRVKIADFGLARVADDASITQSGIIAGTPMYMAPEQALGHALDQRADLFSLGSVLYQMVTGRPPFAAQSTLAVLSRVAEDTPRPIREIIPETPQWLCDLIARLHAKNPDERFQSAGEVADLLARHQAQPERRVLPVAPVEGAPRSPGDLPTTSQPRRQSFHWATAALVLAGLAGLGFAETGGVTNLHGTVIRLFSPEGTLVVEVDDPGVRVSIDGDNLVITGGGVQEIRLKTGPHTLQATKDGKVLRHELVTVTNRGRQVLRVHREAEEKTAAPAQHGPAPAPLEEGTVTTVAARLRALNPDFNGTIRSRGMDGLVIDGPGLQDISPVRALPGLRFIFSNSRSLTDLSSLRGMHLVDVTVTNSGVADLSPLKGMKLTHLEVTGSPVSDLWPIKGMPLLDLQVAYTAVVDLSPLEGMKLKCLNVGGCGRLSDLSPLEGMPLTELNLPGTAVSDLSPLKGMRLTYLGFPNTPVSDISPLSGMPLERVWCDFQPQRDAAILRSIPTLETINKRPAAEFWKTMDAK
jgi:hypothetical protein